MRIVLDTNVLIAAFVAQGQCHELLEHAVRAHRLLTSEPILAELRDKLGGKLRVPAPRVEAAVALLRSRMEVVEPAPLPVPVCRDPDDDWILATAVAARADCLLTGDADLLVLEAYAGISILLPAAFWEYEAHYPEEVGRPSRR